MRLFLASVLGLALVAATAGHAQELAPNRRSFTVVAANGQFTPDRLEVVKDDLVTITFRSEGAPHSFAIDAYRLMKRAGTGETITFQFRADQSGRFAYYCSLSTGNDCGDMNGTLVVADK